MHWQSMGPLFSYIFQDKDVLVSRANSTSGWPCDERGVARERIVIIQYSDARQRSRRLERQEVVQFKIQAQSLEASRQRNINAPSKKLLYTPIPSSARTHGCRCFEN